jgi:hypothetical protein
MNNEDDYNVKELIELKKKIDKSNHKLSEAAKKNWQNAEWREKMLSARKYSNLKRWTAEYRKEWSKKMTEARKNKKVSKPEISKDELVDLKKKYGFEK